MKLQKGFRNGQERKKRHDGCVGLDTRVKEVEIKVGRQGQHSDCTSLLGSKKEDTVQSKRDWRDWHEVIQEGAKITTLGIWRSVASIYVLF